MDKKLKKILFDAFEAPPPKYKREFLRKFPKSEVSNFSFMLSQACYIRKRVWITSIFFFFIAMIGARVIKDNIVWAISAAIPFIAISAITENIRSVTYHMAELEMASRYSLKSIVLARMGIIGVFHILLLYGLMLFSGRYSMFSFWRLGIYLLVPYLLTTVLELSIVRKVNGKEALYICSGITVTISGLNFIVKDIITIFYQNKYLIWWILILIILIGTTIIQYQKNIEQMEELIWN